MLVERYPWNSVLCYKANVSSELELVIHSSLASPEDSVSSQ